MKLAAPPNVIAVGYNVPCLIFCNARGQWGVMLIEEIKTILGDVLQIGRCIEGFSTSTRLLGALPELDSMAVITVISALEQHFGFTVNDDEISAEAFETVGSLCAFVDQKLKM